MLRFYHCLTDVVPLKHHLNTSYVKVLLQCAIAKGDNLFNLNTSYVKVLHAWTPLFFPWWKQFKYILC